MGINLNQGGGDDLGGAGELSEINVTPFIDVVLVLLIIFMVAAPLSTVDAPVDMPLSNAEPRERPDEPIYLTVQSDQTLLIGEDPVDSAALAMALDAATGGNRDERILLRADGAIAYGDLMEVMNALRTAGYLKIGLVGLEDTGAATAAAAVPGQP
ncbi:TonB system transport protein ExbD [Aurantimonas sp. A2-1-M11]|uniref:TonB system transport protein ExbD n=1 Tax=Aurantimonas sp. A2-1-M11 TaxID=3113712 RepID=UPI002F93348F